MPPKPSSVQVKRNTTNMKRKTAKQNPWEKKTEGNDTKLKRATTSKTKRKSRTDIDKE